jgi:NAD(P)-dependent dehydrogenase (short-subunit alcohol dehydrogenase family)
LDNERVGRNGGLERKIALVTGAGRGIGRATAIGLAEAGAKVALVARNSDELNGTARRVVEAGSEAHIVVGDLGLGADEITRIMADVSANLGAVDILVNNAALAGTFGATWEIPAQEWQESITVNLIAPFLLAQLALPTMIARNWGRIINVSSGAAKSPLARAGAYSTTKAGLDMFTRQLGHELEGKGISAISVYPGVVDTEMQTTIRSQPPEKVGADVHARFQSYHSEGRLLQPERPARLIVALAGDAGDNLNGRIVDIYDPEFADLSGE